MSKPKVEMSVIIDNTDKPCNTCGQIQGNCKCECSFCKRLKRDVPGKVLVAGKSGMICKDCVRNARKMVK